MEQEENIIEVEREGNMYHFKTEIKTTEYKNYTVDEVKAKAKYDEAVKEFDNIDKKIYALELEKEPYINIINSLSEYFEEKVFSEDITEDTKIEDNNEENENE